MSKIIVIVLILAVIAALAWLLGGGSRKLGRHSHRAAATRPAGGTHTTTRQLPAGASQLETMRESGVFWGVSLQNPGCDAAMELFEKDIPLTEAPELPIQGCDAVQCNCSWKGLTEQRHTTRRTHHDRRDSVRFDDQEHTDRRSHKDRRQVDKTWERRDF
jgi:hypothetical protein